MSDLKIYTLRLLATVLGIALVLVVAYDGYLMWDTHRINQETERIMRSLEALPTLSDEPSMSPKDPDLAPCLRGSMCFYEPAPERICSTESMPTRPDANSVITYTVPAGWSVWGCLAEAFPAMDDNWLMTAVGNLQWRIDHDPSQAVRDVDDVPVGYTFIGGGDGAGPVPITTWFSSSE